MNELSRRGLVVLSAGLVLGVLGDALLRPQPWGLNMLLMTTALAGLMLGLARRFEIPLRGGGRWLLPVAVLCALGMTWRDSSTLKLLDFLGLCGAFGLAAARGRSGSLRLAGLWDYARALLISGLNTGFGILPLLFTDIEWNALPRGDSLRQTLAIARGLLISLPILLLFGALFASSDAVFAHLLRVTFDIDFDTLLSHLVLIAFFAWVFAGFLRGMLLRAEDAPTTEPPAQVLTLGAVELGIALGLMDLLFLCFVLIQLRYFFGGSALVHATTGLTYAQYARSGFFELVAVAVLVLPLLLLAHWLLPREDQQAQRLFRVLAGIQLPLLCIIMASAVTRMQLYQREYGQTELRFYTTIFMDWLALVFAWFAVTVLRGKRNQFLFGVLVSGYLALGLLHVLNPDARIVQANITRFRIDNALLFDTCYALSLSGDAVPTLIESLPALPPQDRQDIAANLLKKWAWKQRGDWRTWSLGRATAFHTVRDQATALTAMQKPARRVRRK